MWPKETIEWAQAKAKEIRQSYGRRKHDLALGLYQQLDLPYGFADNLETGLWAPWPHELKTVNCQTAASVVYIVAKELGLKPQLKSVIGLRKPGETPYGHHLWVEVDVGRRHRMIVDPMQSIFGYAEYSRNKIHLVRDNQYTHKRDIEFGCIVPLTEKEYCEKLEYQRTPKGKLTMLYEGQKVKAVSRDGWNSTRRWQGPWWIRYDPELPAVESIVLFSRQKLQYRIITATALLENNAVKGMSASFVYAKDYSWLSFQEPKLLANVDIETVRPLVKAVTKFKPADYDSLENILLGHRTHCRQDVQAVADAVKNIAAGEYCGFCARAGTAERGMLLAEAAYQEARAGKRTVYSMEDLRHELMLQHENQAAFEDERNALARKANLHYARLKVTPGIWAKYWPVQRESTGKFDEVRTLMQLHHYDAEHRFCAILDRWLFGERVLQPHASSDAAKPVSAVSHMLDLAVHHQPQIGDFTSKQLRAAYSIMLAEFMTLAASSFDQLRMTKRLPGILQAIIAASGKVTIDQLIEPYRVDAKIKEVART